MILHNVSGNLAAFVAAGLFGASVVATRVAVQEIPPLNLYASMRHNNTDL